MNKILLSLFTLLYLHSHSFSQNEKQLFKSFTNWQAVLDQATKENKNIFVDLYATWCVPCKEMDKYVFPDSSVKGYLGSNFLPVKIQMDKTTNDAEEIKSWYPDVAKIAHTYKINAFPTFLFLSPKGDLLRMETGVKDAPKFIELAKLASDPNEAYYMTLLEYNEGKLPLRKFLSLAIKTNQYHNDSLAQVILKEYKSKWFDRQELSQQLSRDFVDLVFHFPKSVKEQDRIVRYMYKHPEILDLQIYKNITDDYIRYFVSRDFIDPIIAEAERNGKEPDWKSIEKKVAKKYDRNKAINITFDNQLAWYYRKKDWDNVVRLEIEKIEKKGIDNAVKESGMQVNNLVFDIIFKKSKSQAYLLKAAEYMDALLKVEPDDHKSIDTYANVLYKLGKKNEAIDMEKKALALAKAKNSVADQKEFQNVLELMINNQPTWSND